MEWEDLSPLSLQSPNFERRQTFKIAWMQTLGQGISPIQEKSDRWVRYWSWFKKENGYG